MAWSITFYIFLSCHTYVIHTYNKYSNYQVFSYLNKHTWNVRMSTKVNKNHFSFVCNQKLTLVHRDTYTAYYYNMSYLETAINHLVITYLRMYKFVQRASFSLMKILQLVLVPYVCFTYVICVTNNSIIYFFKQTYVKRTYKQKSKI